MLKKLCAEAKVALEFDDARVSFPATPPTTTIPLRSYQEEAVTKLAKQPQGMLVMPCGAGKTVTALALVARLGQPTLVLVHTNDLLSQWKAAVRQWLGFETSEISASSKSGMEASRALVTIGMVPTISRLGDSAFVELVDDFGCVLLDEAHHVSAFTFQRVVNHCHAKYRYGLTATPERADGLTPLLEHYLGPILHQVTYEELLAGGYITPPLVESIPTAFSYNYLDGDDYAPMMDALVNDRPRNLLILARVLESVGPNDCGLVLSGRVAHCELLCRGFTKKGLKAAVLHGKLPRKERESVIARAKSGELNVIAATTVADEGLDIPNLSHAFLVFPTRSAARVIQRVGRVLRRFDGKEVARVHDFVDLEVPVLRHQGIARAKLYRET